MSTPSDSIDHNATTLWLHIHDDVHTTLAVTDASGKVIDDADYPLSALPQAPIKPTPIQVLIPSHRVAFFTLDSTHIPRKKRSQALAFSLEEQLTQAPEQVHAVLLDGPQPSQVMVADRNYLQTLIADLADKNYVVTQLLPESLALQCCNHKHALYLDNDKAMLYSHGHATITCTPSQLDQWLAQLVPSDQHEHVHIYHTDSANLQHVPDTMQQHTTTIETHWLIEQLQHETANFCQEELAPPLPSPCRKPMFWVLAAICVASVVACALSQWWPLHRSYLHQQNQLKQYITQHHANLDPHAPLEQWQHQALQNNAIGPLLLINTINQTLKQPITRIDYQQSHHQWTMTFTSIDTAMRTAWQQALKKHHIDSHWVSQHGIWQLSWSNPS